MCTKYQVEIGEYAQKHYLKSFEKTYKGAWKITWRDNISPFLAKIEQFHKIGKATLIHQEQEHSIFKMEISISGTHFSPKSSGIRGIIYANSSTHVSQLLIIYHKSHIVGTNETTWREKSIKQNYQFIAQIFTF